MKISTKGRYGVRFLMDLAINGRNANVTLKTIAERQDISEKYLWQIVSPLKTAGLIRSVAGPGGGYALARDPATITLREILEALEGDRGLVECLPSPAICSRSNFCAAREVWQEVEERVGSALESFSLQDLASQQQKSQERESLNYVI